MEEIKKFTYHDYLMYKELETLRETGEKYKLEKIHQYRDKGFKLVLEEKEEAVELINSTLGIQDTRYALQKEDIEKYSSSFITQEFKAKELDMVFKKKDEDIFFLIEQQSKVDYSMAYRILNYCIEIIRSAVDTDKLGKKEYQIPEVYPIVLYTGKTKWNAKKYFEECQAKLKGVQQKNFTSYNLIDINNYTEEELWEQDNFLSKILLLEKAKQKDQIKEYLHRIEKENLKDREINLLIKMIHGSYGRRIGKDIQEFVRKITIRKGGDSMLTALEEYLDSLADEGLKKGMEEGMQKGMQKGFQNGKLEMLKQAVKNMLQYGEKDEKIMKYMGIKKEELENIKGMI